MLSRLLLLFAVASWPASAKEAALCSALENLKHEAVTSGPQRIAIFKQEEMTFACGRNLAVPAQVAFCDAAAGPVGLEFTHVFPWLVVDCLRAQRVQSSTALANQYTGIRHRKKIMHVWAGWKDGTRLDIRFRPDGDFGAEPRFKDYWGAYEMVIWLPGK